MTPSLSFHANRVHLAPKPDTPHLKAVPKPGSRKVQRTIERLKDALGERYEIDREIGAGGMATVYLARDLKHDRQVAIKVLRPDVAATLGGERFLREVHIAANLTHPHILSLHDSGEAGDFLYYVMPYLEGESLRDRLSREGELPIHDTVVILREVVDALAYAHDRNVVHRDIKPDNVLLAGRHAMVTDFGVAKAVSEATGRQALTTAGVALGTPAYMAPEQATAEDRIDHRADIYAVGAMAYELLTGQPPFSGTTAQQVLAAHVAETPTPPSSHRSAIAPVLDEFVLRCLEKRPADRYQTANELLSVLETLATPSGGTTPTQTTPVPSVRRATPTSRIAVLTGVTVAVAVLGFLGWASLRGGPPSVTVSNVRQITRAPALESEPAISPDGQAVAYVVGTDSGYGIEVRDLAGGRPIALTADRPGSQYLPRWRPDGLTISFNERAPDFRGAHSMPRFGGPPQLLVTQGVVWDVSDTLTVFTTADGLYVRAQGAGTARKLADNALGRGAVHSAVLSPDGRLVAYVEGNETYRDLFGDLGNVARTRLVVAPTDGGESFTLDDGFMNVSPAWLPDGRHLLYVSNRDGPRDLYVVRVDGNGRLRGTPIRVTTGSEPHTVSVARNTNTAVYSRFSFRRNVWVVSLSDQGVVDLTDGERLTTGNEIIENHGVSRDGRWFAFDSDRSGNADIWIMPAEGGEARQLTTDPADDFHPDFSGDGQEIVFYSMRFGTRDLFLIRADGSGEQRLTDGPGDEYHPVFSPSGDRIAYVVRDRDAVSIAVVTKEQDGSWGSPEFIGAGVGNPPSWSPEGRQLVYRRRGTLRSLDTVMVWSPGTAPRPLFVARDLGLDWMSEPLWGDDGRAIYIRGRLPDGEWGWWSVPVEGGPARLRVRFNDPHRRVAYFSSHRRGRYYLTLTEFESDVWAMDLEY